MGFKQASNRIRTSNSGPTHCQASNHHQAHPNVIPRVSRDLPRCCSHLKLKPTGFAARGFPKTSLRCNSSTRPGGPGPGESDSRSVLDAFFLGKALAEALNERIESTVGEFLSAIGRLQAEQQKQVQDFQEDVLERAKRAKEKAARDAMETQGLIPKSSATASSSNDVETSAISPSSSNFRVPTADTDAVPTNNEPIGVSNDD
ncbi:hypothetical protein F0562_002326 [Nyssa sinensis]|uniref:Uncharacterized protein n=1 Tax=Nyssa sinensis TaxID=561372 RepID=A0A5J5C9B6_9ASTE|nr:hypothetical protein F0562_002326 [Nyssa sinensis]